MPGGASRASSPTPCRWCGWPSGSVPTTSTLPTRCAPAPPEARGSPMCGIVGIVGKSDVNQLVYDALLVLQHRGQDAAGIITSDDKHLYLRKSAGLVRDVFHQRHMQRLKGNMGIGHTRYPTAGCSDSSEAQPFYTNSPYGIALGHNGNLTNAAALKEPLLREDHRHLNTESDSEILLNVFAHELQQVGGVRPDEKAIFKAVAGVHKRCRGGYAVTALVAGY